MHLLVRVVEIKGRCPVYKVGDSFKLEDGYRLVSEIPLCMHSLAALLPYYNALRVSEPEELGLAGREDETKSYVQCLDAASYTDGGTAIFEISKVDGP
ncbi:MAG: TIGR04076 family protein [bacterium]|nr:MAG: TIGR04076 family protein [bacterium]